MNANRKDDHDRVIERIQAEFQEMPGLRLTTPQVRRLFALDEHRCEAVLQALADARVLSRTSEGAFMLRS